MRWRAVALLLLLACRGNLSPLSNKIEVGQEPYVVFAADGEGGVGDLFASPLHGVQQYQITFTRVDERLPALSPDGSMLIFVRSRLPGDTGEVSLVAMNLLNGAERRMDLPAGFRPEATAWSPDGARLYLRGPAGLLAAPAPPASGGFAPVSGAERAAADSALAVLLGEPPLATAEACAAGAGVCARLAEGSLDTIAADGSAPARWPGDSVAYLEQGVWTIRPLAGGRTRQLSWTHGPDRVRELTTFRGAARRK